MVNTFTFHRKHCSSCILHEKCGTKWTTKSFQCTHTILAWQRWADLHFVMTIHKILSLLINKIEQLLTASSGLLDNRCVFTTVISSELSILSGAPLIICLVVQLNASGGTLEAGMLRMNAVMWNYLFSFSCPCTRYIFSNFFAPFSYTFMVHIWSAEEIQTILQCLTLSNWLCCCFCRFLALYWNVTMWFILWYLLHKLNMEVAHFVWSTGK